MLCEICKRGIIVSERVAESNAKFLINEIVFNCGTRLRLKRTIYDVFPEWIVKCKVNLYDKDRDTKN